MSIDRTAFAIAIEVEEESPKPLQKVIDQIEKMKKPIQIKLFCPEQESNKAIEAACTTKLVEEENVKQETAIFVCILIELNRMSEYMLEAQQELLKVKSAYDNWGDYADRVRGLEEHISKLLQHINDHAYDCQMELTNASTDEERDSIMTRYARYFSEFQTYQQNQAAISARDVFDDMLAFGMVTHVLVGVAGAAIGAFVGGAIAGPVGIMLGAVIGGAIGLLAATCLCQFIISLATEPTPLKRKLNIVSECASALFSTKSEPSKSQASNLTNSQASHDFVDKKPIFGYGAV